MINYDYEHNKFNKIREIALKNILWAVYNNMLKVQFNLKQKKFLVT